MSGESELQALQQTQGATFATADSPSESVGPLNFGNSKHEFRTARESSALFDLGHRTQLEVTGVDRQKFVHSFCTNEIRGLKSGRSCEAFVTTIQGKVLAHIFVFAESHALWIDCVGGLEDKLFQHFDKYVISEDITFHRRSADWTEFYLSGPQSATQLNLMGLTASTLDRHQHERTVFETIPLSLRRVDWLNEVGFLVQVPTVHAPTLWSRLTTNGITPAGHEAFEGLRILAMFPHYGIDITEQNLAQEVARTELAISFTKGCYLGQEPIARIDSLGHVNQELRGLKLARGPLPDRSAKVLMPGEVREAGTVTSAAWDYSTDTPVALALLKRNYMSAGRELTVAIDGKEIQAVVFDRT